MSIPYKLLVVTTCCLLTLSGAGSQDGKRARVLEKQVQPNELIEVTAVRMGESSSGKRDLKIGSPLLAGDDWVRGLTFRVKSNATKPITYLELELDVLKSEHSRDTVGIDLVYGRMPPLPGANNDAPAAKTINPGEEVELSLSDSQYDTFMELLRRNRGSTAFDKLQVRTGRIVFDDGTMWYNGQTLTRDPADPQRWNVVRPRSAVGRLGPRRNERSLRPQAVQRGAAVTYVAALFPGRGGAAMSTAFSPPGRQADDCRREVGSY